MEYTKEFKIKVVKDALNGMKARDIKRKYSMEGEKYFRGTYFNWVATAKKSGINSLNDSRAKEKYSSKLKEKVIIAYLNGEKAKDISRKYLNNQHSDINIIKYWVRSNGATRKRGGGHSSFTTQKLYQKLKINFNKETHKYIGRRTDNMTIAEKRDLAKICIENKKFSTTTITSILKEIDIKQSSYYYKPIEASKNVMISKKKLKKYMMDQKDLLEEKELKPN